AFSICFNKAGLSSTERLVFILPYATEKQAGYLSNRLALLATRGAEGDLEKLALLLASPVSQHYDYTEALKGAALRKDRKMLDLLLPRSATTLGAQGEKLLKLLKEKNADAE